MDYKFYFDNTEDAEYFCNRVSEIAKDYDTVRLSDLYDLVGEPCNYLASKVIWTKDSIVLNIHYDCDIIGRYYVKFPEPDQYLASTRKSYKDYYHATSPRSTVKPKNTPEPLNITLTIDPSKDSYITIREVIQQANEIKGRPVFITINSNLYF